jgi:hypothetical protein
VHELSTYNYAIIRVVPRVDREEFVNVGVIVSCPERGFLESRIEVDEGKLRALDPAIDMALVWEHLSSIPVICRGGPGSGPIGELPGARRFEWLAAPKSTIIQTSPAHTGRCADPSAVLGALMDTMVRYIAAKDPPN